MFRRLKHLILCAAVGFGLTVSEMRADTAPTVIGITAAALIIGGEVLKTPQPDASRAFIIGGAGYFDILKRRNPAASFHFEYRPPWQIWRLKPMLGAFGTSDGAVAGFFGIGYDLHVTNDVVINVNTAATFYNAGNGLHLGSFAVLRSGVEIGWRLDDGARLMLSYHHMSHGRLLDDRNPGADVVAITYQVPVDNLAKLLGR